MTVFSRQPTDGCPSLRFFLKAIIASGGAFVLSACANGGAISDTRLVVSDPDNAYVSIRDSRERELFNCQTPCQIKVADSLLVIVSKEGYTAQRFYVAPGRGVIRVKLNLAAASEAVDSVSLPELN
ncbi:MAG: hypothetical protein AAGK25_00295 [Pseudomonadota bacterium]